MESFKHSPSSKFSALKAALINATVVVASEEVVAAFANSDAGDFSFIHVSNFTRSLYDKLS